MSMIEAAIKHAGSDNYTLVLEVADGASHTTKIVGSVLEHGPGWVHLEVISGPFESARKTLGRPRVTQFFNERYVASVKVERNKE